nr:hypothetical protein [Tanacetum cinerariifolium]
MANLIQDNKHLEERLDSHGSRLYALENLDIPQQVSKAVDEIVTNAVDWAIQAPLRNRFRDLPKADIKEILHQRMWETNPYKAHEDHMMLYEALENSINRDHTDELLKDLAQARRKKKKRHYSPKIPHGSPPHQPPPPPPPTGPSRTLGSPGASGSSQLPTPLPPSTSQNRPATPKPAWSIPSSDLPVPTNNWASALASTYTPPPENSLLAHTGDMYQIEECQKLPTDSMDESIIRYNVSKPLPLGGPPGQVTIQPDFFFNKDLEYLRYGSKGGRPALSISKMKATYYPNAGLEQMVPYQMWIEEECKYDIAAMYGISHWWFQRQRFYIDKHTFEGDRRAVRTHMQILSVVRIKVFSMYGYDYIKKIVLRRADLNEALLRKETLNICTQDATGFEYKHDFMVIDSPRAITFRDKYGVQMIMRFNEIHKFSDGTLHQIDEELDYQVKEFKVNRMNPGLNIRFWTRKDVDRSKEFMFSIQKRLKTRRIFCNLESFIGGRILRGSEWCMMAIVEIPKTNPERLKKEKSKNKGRVPTEMELELEQTQQGSSYEVSVSVEGVEE